MSTECIDLGVTFWVHREKGGHLLAITTDRTSLTIEPGDRVLKQRWLPTSEEEQPGERLPSHEQAAQVLEGDARAEDAQEGRP